MPEKNTRPKTTVPPNDSAPKSAGVKKPTTATPASASSKKPAATAPASSKKPAATASASPNAKKPAAAAPAKASAKRPAKSKSGGNSFGGGKGSAVAVLKNPKTRIILICVLAAILVISLIVGIALGVKACGNDAISPVDKFSSYDIASHKTTTQVGVSGKVLGKTGRVKPVAETKDGGLETGYPTYGKNMGSVLGESADKVEKRNAIIAEANYLTGKDTRGAGGGEYTWMDENGYLYGGTRAEPVELTDKYLGGKRRLYKHTASVGLYRGDVADDEPGIVKQVTLRNRGYTSYSVTGVYAPAGEVIKIQISEADMEATGGIQVHIGQALYNGQANNIWAEKNSMPRIPFLLNTMTVNKNTAVLENGVYTAYVGSFIGGPVYIRNTSATFTATISGGVAYSHFILGYTTKEEFEQNAKSTAPYFDLEVWNFGVLHSGPKVRAQNFTYEDLYKAAILWEKVSSVTTTGSNQGIVFLYDPFVAAGGAVAFPGRSSVNCPDDWMTSSLNYNGLITSGSWGNFHEYHHNFQGYGVGNGGEVTNNAMTLVSYSLFTKISSARGLAGNGSQGLGGWNSYTSAGWALSQTLNTTSADGNLSLYATLLHNFGPDNFIQAKRKQQTTYGGENYVNYLKAWQDVTHNDMTYYFKDILKGITNEQAGQLTNKDYSMFVPIASVFQTGRSYMYDGEKRYMKSEQPYVIQYDEDFKVDLNKYTNNAGGQYESGSIILPEGFSYKIKNITQPEYGKLTPTGEKNIYTYTPDKDHLDSGKIIVTLEITKDDGAFKVDDVDLVLEFEQTHEKNKYVLERTTYLYEGDTKYSNATDAYEAGYAGFTQKFETDNLNSTQNSNTDVWLKPFDSNQVGHPHYYPGDNAVIEVRGKIHIDETAKYRLAIRGRYNVALYYSVNDSDSFELAGKYIHSDSHNGFRPDLPETYTDLELNADDWVYFKAVMLCQKGNSFIGVGFGKFTPPLGTMDEDGNLVGGTEETVTISYASAYRNDYEFPEKEFETDYMYRRKFKYSYTDNVKLAGEEGPKLVEAHNMGLHKGWGGTDLNVLFDGITGSGNALQLHSTGRPGDNKPFTFTVDLGGTFKANRFLLYSQGGRTDPCFPNSLTLYGSLDGTNFFTIKSYNDIKTTGCAPISGGRQTFDFDETELRYYKIEIFESMNGYIILREFEMWHINEVNNGDLYSPDDDMFKYEKNWWGAAAQSTFGHVYVGKNNSTVTFEFEGNRVGILSTAAYGNDFEVYVDGKKIDSIALKDDNGQIKLAFLSDKFDDGKHTVKIKCKGDADIDSIVTYNN